MPWLIIGLVILFLFIWYAVLRPKKTGDRSGRNPYPRRSRRAKYRIF